MNFGNLNKMQNTQLNEDNEEGRTISEYDEYLKKIAKNDFPSTKSKDCPVKIPNECKLIKKDETGYNDGAKIIKTKDISEMKNTHLKAEKENNKVELPNLNSEQNLFSVDERKNEVNLIFLSKKVKNNKLDEKKVNEKNKNQKQKKKVKRANLRKKLKKKKISKSKKEEDNEIPSEIIKALFEFYEGQKTSGNIHIPIQTFEEIKTPFKQNSQIDKDEILTENALININTNRYKPRYIMQEENIITYENYGENLFDLNEYNHSEIGWVNLNLPTNEFL